ncbi:MAG: septation protein SepH [Actinomycetota bacterium]|nr:septation protein SepH [Actinomycetota bacterium]
MPQPARRPPRLKPVGVNEDGTEILVAPSSGRRVTHRLPIDSELVDALEDAQAARTRARAARAQAELPPPVESVESSLTVREIQNLLRQGRPVAAIAKKAGVEEAWVRRWEGPIVWERAGAATRARRATQKRPRGGPSKVPLGESVLANLKKRGISLEPEMFDYGWDSTKKARGGNWIVTFTFDQRKRQRTARWDYDPEHDTVKPLDELAASLGWVERARRR